MRVSTRPLGVVETLGSEEEDATAFKNAKRHNPHDTLRLNYCRWRIRGRALLRLCREGREYDVALFDQATFSCNPFRQVRKGFCFGEMGNALESGGTVIRVRSVRFRRLPQHDGD